MTNLDTTRRRIGGGVWGGGGKSREVGGFEHACMGSTSGKFWVDMEPYVAEEDVEDSVRASRRRHGSAPQMRVGKGVDARTQEASPHGLRTRGARAAEGEEGSGMTRAKWVERERASL
ncbi:hypothetical protein B0H10DRAFT_1948814 [Mycena sp. CBHHK59/15]|nr:hypothetical protein B0H10DRAFT_1948814 [Mycena sp. CBHHK59/15]